MNKSELESKHLAELHTLAAEAGIERYRMLPRAELIEKLAGENGGSGSQSAPRKSGESSSRRRRSRGGRSRGEGRESREEKSGEGERQRAGRERKPREPRRREREPKPEAEAEAPKSEPTPEPSTAPATTPEATTPPPAERPKRKRRRRRWGRKRKDVRVQDLLLPAAPGRQAIVYAETREGCTALLHGVAAELADASDGADPIALLIDPTPEELAEWRREAPQAEIVAAGQARHAEDALAQATSRAGGGENVVVLIDSLSRFAESYGDPDAAKDLFDAGRTATGTGSLTVVAAVEKS